MPTVDFADEWAVFPLTILVPAATLCAVLYATLRIVRTVQQSQQFGSKLPV